jgi:hypothetical protein
MVRTRLCDQHLSERRGISGGQFFAARFAPRGVSEAQRVDTPNDLPAASVTRRRLANAPAPGVKIGPSRQVFEKSGAGAALRFRCSVPARGQPAYWTNHEQRGAPLRAREGSTHWTACDLAAFRQHASFDTFEKTQRTSEFLEQFLCQRSWVPMTHGHLPTVTTVGESTNPANDRKFHLTCSAIDAYSRVDRAASRCPKRIINQFRDAMVTC